jgi:acyl-coenzyme A synthetase/AMP-(fatty) acid ligase
VLLRRRKSDTATRPGSHPTGWEIPARFNYVRDVIEPLARKHSRAALTFVDREGIVDRRSFGEIAGDAARWAHLLRTRLDRGDRVLVVTGRVPAWQGAMLGALKGGLISVPCSNELRARDLALRVRHSGARLVIADRSCEVEIEEMLEQLDTTVPVVYVDDARAELNRYMGRAPTEDTTAGERAFLLYTSGTTKEPRGVVHTHAYTWAARSQAEHWLDVQDDDVVWCTADPGWAKSIWNVLLGPWSHGAETVLHEGSFDAEDRLGLLGRLGVTVLCQTPSEYRMLARLDALGAAHLPRLRHAVSAGEPLHPDVIESFQDALGLTVHDGYGQTETSLLVANAPGMEVRPGSMGLPAPGHDVAVIDEDGDLCDPGMEGDIALFGRPPTLFAGYWEDRDETDAAFRDGWYVTGDRGVSDEQGYLWFVGRDDDVILSGGYRVAPFEVESALFENRAVAEAAVVGTPDPERGEIVKAFVVLRPGHDPTADLVSDLQEHVKTVIAPYKYPREIAFVEELPRTTSGKLRRSDLRRQHETGVPEPLSLVIPLPVDEIERARAADEAAEVARLEAREEARRKAAESARRAAERAANREAEEAVLRAEEAARRATAEATLREAAESARREAEETARVEAEELARLEAEARTQQAAAEAARREADEAARREAEAAARREAEEAARHAAETAAQREAEEAARREAEAAARREAEEAARGAAEDAARREAEAAARLAAQEAARREAEAAVRLAAEEAARREAEEAARRAAEEAARHEAAARKEAEEAAWREAQEAARRAAAEEAARRETEAAAQREAEEAARRETEAAAQREAEAAAQREVEEAARREAETQALREAEAHAQREAEEAAHREAEAEAEHAGLAVEEPDEGGEKGLSRRQRREAEKRRKEEERLRARAEEARRKRAEQEAKEQAKADAEQRKRDEIEAKERAKADAEQRKRDEIEAKERAKADAEQRKLEEIEARERARAEAKDEKEREKEEQRRQRELAKLAKGKGLGLGRLLAREEEDLDEDDGEPVVPIEDIVQRLQPYSRPTPPTAVPGVHDEQTVPAEEQDPSD